MRWWRPEAPKPSLSTHSIYLHSRSTNPKPHKDSPVLKPCSPNLDPRERKGVLCPHHKQQPKKCISSQKSSQFSGIDAYLFTMEKVTFHLNKSLVMCKKEILPSQGKQLVWLIIEQLSGQKCNHRIAFRESANYSSFYYSPVPNHWLIELKTKNDSTKGRE